MVGEPKVLQQLLVLVLVVIAIVAIPRQFGVFDDENNDWELTWNFERNGIASSSVANTIVAALATHQSGFGVVSIGSGLATTSEIACDLCDTLGLTTITTIQNGHKKKSQKRKEPTSYKERFNRQKKAQTSAANHISPGFKNANSNSRMTSNASNSGNELINSSNNNGVKLAIPQ